MTMQIFEIHMSTYKDGAQVGDTLIGQFRGSLSQLHKTLRRDLNLRGPEFYELTSKGEVETLAAEEKTMKFKIVGPLEG